MSTAKNIKSTKGLVENYTAINVHDFGRDLLNVQEGIENCGTIQLHDAPNRHVFFEVRQSSKENPVEIFLKHPFLQIIRLEAVPLTFGLRPYFYCPQCSSRRVKLYRHRERYACRECLNLTHESTRLRRNNVIFRQFSRMQRLMRASEKVHRVTYAGKYTRKAQRLMEQIECQRI